MNEMIMVCHSLNNNTRTGLIISLCLNANPLIGLIPLNDLELQTFTQLWYNKNRSNVHQLLTDFWTGSTFDVKVGTSLHKFQKCPPPPPPPPLLAS